MVQDEVRGTCGKRGKENNSYSMLVGKPDAKRPPGFPRPKCSNNFIYVCPRIVA